MPSENEISLRERIRLNLIDGMKNAGLNQVQLAEKLGISKATVNNWTRGNNSPDVDMVPQICKALGIAILDLYIPRDDEPSEHPTPPKNTPSELSEEAKKIAKDYEKLDDRGRGAVKAVLHYESGALSEQPAVRENTSVVKLPKARRNRGMVEIDVYDQPAAAGLGNYLDQPDSHVEQYPDGVIPPDADFGIIISGDSMEPKIHSGGTVFVQASLSIDPGKIGIFVLNGQSYCKKLAVDHDKRQIRLVSLNPRYKDIIVGEYDAFRTVGRVLGQWTKGYPNDDIFGW